MSKDRPTKEAQNNNQRPGTSAGMSGNVQQQKNTQKPAQNNNSGSTK